MPLTKYNNLIGIRSENYNDMISRLYPGWPYNREIDTNKVQTANVTFQVTDDCTLRCTYCYQINKGHHVMELTTAQKFIDMLLDNDKNTQQYLDTRACKAVIIEFIGGEPFMQPKLMDEIMEYFLKRMVETDHPWQYNWRISISSNGTLYFEPEVQHFINKYKDHLSLGISIDGNKELHDACRVFPDGSGSYDIAMKAVRHYVDVLGGTVGSKMTLAPENVEYTYDAVTSLIENGYTDIHLNCVFEKGWEPKHATILYYQLTKLADYIFENDLEDKVYIAMFEEFMFHPKSRDDTQNWCWGAGTPILTDKGYRPIEELKVGDYVYTHDGSLKPVINIMSHFADNCVTIKGSGTFDMVCTDNHKLFVKPFDYIGNKGVKHWLPNEKREVKNIQHKDMVKLFTLPDSGNTQEFSEDFAYLIGRYVGDGWDMKNHRSHLICCAFDEIDELRERLDSAGVEYSHIANKTVEQFTITRNPQNSLNEFLHNELEKCGHLATGKHLPEDFTMWSRDNMESFLKGYVDADGYYDAKNKKYKINTVSYQLAQDLMLLLRTLGYTPTCYVNHRGGKGTILGRTVNLHDRYEIYYYEDPTRTIYVKQMDDGLYEYGLKTSPTEPQMVYNITVADNHSYVAGGIVSSNCGGNGAMISVDWKGDIYPCIRYMESSLGSSREPIIIGNVNTGIMTDAKCRNCINCLKQVNRINQSTEECLDCPIAEGCAWCQAYNYQESGDFNHRATYICIMHKARALANAYYWNFKYRKHNEMKRMKIWLPDEESLKIISQDELLLLKYLQYPVE